MKILKLQNNTKEIIDEAINALKSSELIVFPTETCYGAGVLATDQKAVDKLLKFKKRPHGKPISVAVDSMETANNYVDLNNTAKKIYKKFLPGPVTVVSNYKGGLADGLASEFGTLGIRVPDYEIILQILSKLQLPISSTSANSAGKKTPYSLEDVLSGLSDTQKALIGLVIDAGKLPKNPPSTVMDTTKQDLQVIRLGQLDNTSRVKKIVVNNTDEMQNLGKMLIKENMKDIQDHGLVILFNAELGAGKTQFVKGVGAELGIAEIIKSPTYSILEEYEINQGKLIHIDAWRLENLAELKQLGLGKYLKNGNVVAIEWAGGAQEYLLDTIKKSGMKLISIDITYLDENTRKMRIIYS